MLAFCASMLGVNGNDRLILPSAKTLKNLRTAGERTFNVFMVLIPRDSWTSPF